LVGVAAAAGRGAFIAPCGFLVQSFFCLTGAAVGSRRSFFFFFVAAAAVFSVTGNAAAIGAVSGAPASAASASAAADLLPSFLVSVRAFAAVSCVAHSSPGVDFFIFRRVALLVGAAARPLPPARALLAAAPSPADGPAPLREHR
jgi:hypothetical protein